MGSLLLPALMALAFACGADPSPDSTSHAEGGEKEAGGGEMPRDDIPIDGGGVVEEDARPCSADGWCPTDLSTSPLEAIWGSSPNDIWAVGWYGTIVHWDGSKWTPFESGTRWPLYGIWGRGPSDVWAVGRHDTILHWDGAVWSAIPTGTLLDFARVWGNEHGDIWVFSARSVYRNAFSWNGVVLSRPHGASDWTPTSLTRSSPGWIVDIPFTSGPGHFIADAWPATSDTAWVVDVQQCEVFEQKQLADGGVAITKSRAAGEVEYPCGSIWGSSTADVWVAGPRPGIVFHYEHSKWSLSSTAIANELLDCSLRDFWGFGADDVWVVGRCYGLDYAPVGVALRRRPVERRDGGSVQ